MSAHAPDTIFSSGRAMQHLEIIAQKPHPVGPSQAHAEVRDYLLHAIRLLDLEPQVQRTFGFIIWGPSPGYLSGGFVENLLVRLPGNSPDGAILVMAHYDSTPGGPGAADNGSGVSTILEILRALHASPSLRHDVIFLFADGEEPGTIGAQAFVSQHPWFEDVRLVINLDEISNAPATLLRTIGENGIFVQAMAFSAPRPASISLPLHLFPGNDTDLTPFIPTRVSGADFCATAKFTELHTSLDRFEVVSPASVQHIGEQLLAMIRYLGNQPSLEIKLPEEIYFPLVGRMVHYPVTMAYPLMILAGLCFIGTLIFGVLKRELSLPGLVWGLSVFLFCMALSIGIVNLFWFGIQHFHPEYQYSQYRPRLSNDFLYAIGFIVLTLAIFMFMITIVRKKVSALNLVAGAMTIWFPITVAATIIIPETSHLFTWPLFSGSLTLLLALSIRAKKMAWVYTGSGFLFNAVLGTFLWIPMIYYGFLGASFPMLSLIIGETVLLCGTMLPALVWILKLKGWALPAFTFLVALGFVLSGHLVVSKDSPPPFINPIGYWLDADEGDAYWVTFSDELDERQTELLVHPVRRPYTELLQEAPPLSTQTSAAPVLDLDGPRLEALSDEWRGDKRVIQARVTTAMHERITIIIPKEFPILAITLPDNKRTELSPVINQDWILRFDGLPVEGIEIIFEFSWRGPIRFLLIEERTGLPSFLGLLTQPEPGTMKSPGVFSQEIPTDFIAIKKSFVIQKASR